MPAAYILFSPSLDSYYVGATTLSPQERLARHNEKYYLGKHTARADDWVIFKEIECETIAEAMFIERYIKKMKSRKYLNDLARYPEIIEKIRIKFRAPDP
jgi:putative endonuclease